MNYSFKLADVKVKINDEVKVNIGCIEYSVENLDMKDSLAIIKELPTIITDVRKALEDADLPIRPEDIPSSIDEDDFPQVEDDVDIENVSIVNTLKS